MSKNILGDIDQIPQGEGRTFAVDGRQIAVFRLPDDTVRALDAVCPHRGGPLADALIDGDVVVCPLHGYTYSHATGDELAFDGEAVKTYSVTVDSSGKIAIDM